MRRTPNYNIFEAGPEMARAPAPPADAPESDTFYTDQVLVEHLAVGEGVAEMERPPDGASAAPPDQSPATSHTPAGDRADTEAGPHGPVPPLAAGLRPGSRAAMNCVPPLPRTATDPDHVPFHGKPPSAAPIWRCRAAPSRCGRQARGTGLDLGICCHGEP